MYRTNLFILFFSILLIPVIVFAIVDASKSYQAGLMAYNYRNYKKAIKLLETAIEANLSGDELKDAYLKLYFCSYILKDKRRTEHYERRCHDYIPGFKSIDSTEFKLEFKIIGDQHELENALKGNIPPESIIEYRIFKISHEQTVNFVKEPYLLQKIKFNMSHLITDVKIKKDYRWDTLYLQVKLNEIGAESFKKITSKNINKKFAIVLNNVLIGTFTIQEEISDGVFSIYDPKYLYLSKKLHLGYWNNGKFIQYSILNDIPAMYALIKNHIAQQ